MLEGIFFNNGPPGSSETGYFCLEVVHAKLLQSCPTLCDPVDYSPLGSSGSMGFSRQEYWSELPFLPPGDLPDPGIEPTSLNVSGSGKQVLYH